MTGISQGWAGYAAPDLDAAEAFYTSLGIATQRDHEMGVLTLKLSGDVPIYVKPDHVPATFTVLNLLVADLERAVDDAVAAGATFARYEGFDQDQRGIARGPVGPAIAWTADPAGNVVAFIEEA